MGGLGKKPSPKARGIFNCPCLRRGLETLEYDFPQRNEGKDGEGD
jgi:hypothetical protein